METPLNKMMTARNLKLVQVAEATSVDKGTISRLRRGTPASRETAEAIAKAYPGAITEMELIYPERYIGNSDAA